MSTPRKPVPSPCISICQMDETSGWCSGCLRTLEEIAAWSTLAETEKLAVWRRLPARRVLARRLRHEGSTPPPPTAPETP